jgi:hypothetical protein
MKKLTLVTLGFVLSVLLIVMGFSAMAHAQGLPVCQLGGPTAMNPDRQLAEGETFVITDRPLVVNLRFRPTKEHPERVGECMLPAGSKVAQKNDILQWVVKCGNDEVNRNIFVVPFTPLRGLPGIPGRPGKDGYTPVKGVDYFDGKDGYDGRNGKNGKNGFCSSKKCKVMLLAIGGAAAGYAAWYYWPCPPGTTRKY